MSVRPVFVWVLMPLLVATTPLVYAGRRLTPGAEFVASKADAKILTLIKKAKYPEIQSGPVRIVETLDPGATTILEQEDSTATLDILPRPKRAYRRRVPDVTDEA